MVSGSKFKYHFRAEGEEFTQLFFVSMCDAHGLRDFSHRRGARELSFPDTAWACNLYLLSKALIRLSINHIFKYHWSQYPLNKCLHFVVSICAFLNTQQCQRKLRLMQMKWLSPGCRSQNQCCSTSSSLACALVAELPYFWPFESLNSTEALCCSTENYLSGESQVQVVEL